MSEWVVEVAEADFERLVIERSKQVPVVVDFWAPWCGPCRALGPLLERLADEYTGAFVVAKVNVDDSPALAGAFGAQSIPMVLGLRDGKVAAEFVGALPETAVREFLARLLPSEGERLASEAAAAYAAGKPEDAEGGFRASLDLDPRCDAALLGLARLFVDRGDDAEALTMLERIAPGTAERHEADRLAAVVRVKEGGSGDEGELQAKVEARPDDLESRFALAQSLAASGQYAPALEQYLAVVGRDREFRDDAARKAMLDIFELLGAGDETVERYRAELAKVLFR